MWRWPEADPREVVDLAGAGTLADGVGEADLGTELRHWRGVVARRRLVALLRRQGALALALAAVLEVLALVGLFPQWVVVAVPLAALLVSVGWFAAHGPSPFGLARLLDDKLGLNDRLATALEIEARGGEESALERRTVADAAALLRAGREDWRASAAEAGHEWWAPVGAVALLAIVIAVGAATGGSSSSAPTSALGPNGGGGAGGPNGLESEYAKHLRHHSKGQNLAPTGKLHKFKGKRVSPSQIQAEAAKEGYQQIPQVKGTGKAKAGAAGKGKGNGAGKSGKTSIHQSAEGAKPGSGAGKNSKRGSGKGPNEAEHPTVGFNVKGKKHGNHGRKGNSEVSGAGAKKSAPNGQGDESSSSAAQAGPGTKSSPASGTKAGGEQGNNSQGHATPITGQASQAVKIHPGYAPSRASKAGKEGKKEAGYSQGGGGKARTGRVTGGTQVGEEFTYVPAAGGAVPGPSAGIQRNYLESLKWIERLPW
ncbi:MAG TPA: hypothetical protein VHA76_10040 [Solirubrobacterales bacterium]|nr:hypothetical protein [Solirubrobacterales bacterium]